MECKRPGWIDEDGRKMKVLRWRQEELRIVVLLGGPGLA